MNLEFFIKEEQFIQAQPLELDRFISFCKKRKLNVNRELLEFFDNKRLFFPILRIKRPKIKEKIERISEN